jgi:hypothetical protein
MLLHVAEKLPEEWESSESLESTRRNPAVGGWGSRTPIPLPPDGESPRPGFDRAAEFGNLGSDRSRWTGACQCSSLPMTPHGARLGLPSPERVLEDPPKATGAILPWEGGGRSSPRSLSRCPITAKQSRDRNQSARVLASDVTRCDPRPMGKSRKERANPERTAE